MARSIYQQLATIGKQLAHPPHTKDLILKLLKQAADMLSELKQSQDAAGPLQSLTESLVFPTLMGHKDKDVRLLTTCCIMEIMRIVAPDAPYDDKEFQEIFRLAVTAFAGLNEISSSSFPRRTAILEIMANLRIVVVMLDVGCDDLILEMFKTFFSVISDQHPPSVLAGMQTAMAAVLQESGSIPIELLDVILRNLLKHNKVVTSAAHKLAVGVVQQCAEKLEPYVQRLLTSVMLEGKATEIDLHADYHDIIHEIYQWAPQMLLAVIPNLTQELVNDNVEVRLKAVKLLGRLFALPGQHVSKEYRQLFSEFMKRFTDKAVEIRSAMVECAKNCLKANWIENEGADMLAGLHDRILDSEEAIRLHSVSAICDVAKRNLKWVPTNIIADVAERLRDKKVLVRKEAFQKLAEVYRAYCIKCSDGYLSTEKDLEWIPGKLIRCCYDKDVKEFRPAGIEILLSENLFPRQFSVMERTRHWIAIYLSFGEYEKKALGRVLAQKKRLQEELSHYLILRDKEKGLSSDDPRVERLLKSMSLSFLDVSKAEENLRKLHNMKDKNVFKCLLQLLDPATSFHDSEEITEDLSRRVGESHPQHDFLKMLATKSSFRIFGKEHAKAVLEVVSLNATLGMDMVAAGLSLLADFSGFFPFLIKDAREGLLALLGKGDDTVKERVADILARAGSAIRGNVNNVNSSTELILQTLCLEGTRKQAKFAVSALLAINVDEGFKSLSIVYERLIESLKEENPHLPTVLQALSCIAQHAMPIFETQEDDIVRFVVRNLLQKSHVGQATNRGNSGWKSLSKISSLQIYGLKALVKSFLPLKDHGRKRLQGLLGLLSKLVVKGCIFENSGLSDIDKAHLRLASAKGVLRLARRWDSQIPVELFHACIYVGQDTCLEVKQHFLKKVHQYLRDRTLNHKYAAAYAFFALESSKEILTSAKHNLVEFVDVCRREVRMQQQNSSGTPSEACQITHSPEYVLTYLVHALAHHPSFPDFHSSSADGYEFLYRVLLFYLKALSIQESDSLGKEADNIPAILAIFRTIRRADNVLEDNKTDHFRVLCEIGIVITKELGRSSLHSKAFPGIIPLPSACYTVKETGEYDTDEMDGLYLPACLVETDALSQFWSLSYKPGQSLPASLSYQVKKDTESLPDSTIREKNSTHSQDLMTSSKECAHPQTRSRKGTVAPATLAIPVSRRKKNQLASIDGSGSEKSKGSPTKAQSSVNGENSRPQTRSRKAAADVGVQAALNMSAESTPSRFTRLKKKHLAETGSKAESGPEGAVYNRRDTSGPEDEILIKNLEEKVINYHKESSEDISKPSILRTKRKPKESPQRIEKRTKIVSPVTRGSLKDKREKKMTENLRDSCEKVDESILKPWKSVDKVKSAPQQMEDRIQSPSKDAFVRNQVVQGAVSGLRKRAALHVEAHDLTVAGVGVHSNEPEQETLATWRSRRRKVL